MFYIWEKELKMLERRLVSLYCLASGLTVSSYICKSGTQKTCLNSMLIQELLA